MYKPNTWFHSNLQTKKNNRSIFANCQKPGDHSLFYSCRLHFYQLTKPNQTVKSKKKVCITSNLLDTLYYILLWLKPIYNNWQYKILKKGKNKIRDLFKVKLFTIRSETKQAQKVLCAAKALMCLKCFKCSKCLKCSKC